MRFQDLHLRIQKHLQDMKNSTPQKHRSSSSSSSSSKKQMVLVRMVSELALHFQLEQEYFAEEIGRLNKLVRVERHKSTIAEKHGRQMLRLRKTAQKMHGEILRLRTKNGEGAAKLRARDERIAHLAEENKRYRDTMKSSSKRLQFLEKELVQKSNALENALGTTAIALAKQAKAEKRLMDIQLALRSGHTPSRVKKKKKKTSTRDEFDQQHRRHHRRRRRRHDRHGNPYTHAYPPSRVRERNTLLVVPELRELLINLWDHLLSSGTGGYGNIFERSPPELRHRLATWCERRVESGLTMHVIKQALDRALHKGFGFDDFLKELCRASEEGDVGDEIDSSLDTWISSRHSKEEETFNDDNDDDDDDDDDYAPPGLTTGKLHARRQRLDAESSTLARRLGTRPSREKDEISLRISETCTIVSDLQHWSLRRLGTADAKSIAIDLGNAVIRLTKTMELYLQRPRNTRAVKAALLGVQETLKYPKQINYDDVVASLTNQKSRMRLRATVRRRIRAFEKV
eukprot:g164.t1